MGGGTELQMLLRNLEPVRRPGIFVFSSLPGHRIPTGVEAAAAIEEDEGLTLVLEKWEAERCGINGIFPCAWITLKVHSDLAAVGLTAAVSAALAREGIACNVIAGYHHDHLLVPAEDADRALEILRALASGEPDA